MTKEQMINEMKESLRDKETWSEEDSRVSKMLFDEWFKLWKNNELEPVYTPYDK